MTYRLENIVQILQLKQHRLRKSRIKAYFFLKLRNTNPQLKLHQSQNMTTIYFALLHVRELVSCQRAVMDNAHEKNISKKGKCICFSVSQVTGYRNRHGPNTMVGGR